MTAFQKIRSILTPAERKGVLILMYLTAIGTVLETMGVGVLFPVMILLVQDDLPARYPQIQPLFEYFGNPNQVQLIWVSMFCLVGIYLFKNIFSIFFAWQNFSFTSRVQVELSQRLFTAYMRQPYTFHLQRNSARLTHNITQGGVVVGAIANCLLIVSEGLVLLGIAALLLMVEPLGALIVMIVFATASWGFYYATRARLSRWGKARLHHDRLKGQHMSQGFGGVKDVKLLGRENSFLAHYYLHNTESAQIVKFQSLLQQIPRMWLEFLTVTGLALLVLSILGQGHSTDRIVPTLGLFAAAAFRLMPSVNRLLSAVQSLRFVMPAIDLVHEEAKLIAAGAGAANENRECSPLVFKTEICTSNIDYVYPGATTHALNQMSITIKKGESVGFIGSSGSGKSTLVDVILGLLPPTAGQVTVDGSDIQKNLRAWQNQIGYVPQSIYLTDDTLKRNVAFGLPNEEIDEAALKRAIQNAQLEEFVAGLPNGLETVVGERGVRLSGGQRQRIGIARALYHDPSVLVLDEATSALDTDTESGVMQAVTSLRGSKTILIIAHRLSTVAHCDRLYRLEHGMIVAEGTPAELLSAKGDIASLS